MPTAGRQPKPTDEHRRKHRPRYRPLATVGSVCVGEFIEYSVGVDDVGVFGLRGFRLGRARSVLVQ